MTIFTMLNDVMRDALSAVCKSIDEKNTGHPVLRNVLIQADGSKITFTGSNMTTTVVSHASGRADRNGELAVDAHVLLDVLNSFGMDRVDMNWNDQNFTLNLRCGTSEINIKGENPADYPLLTELHKPVEAGWTLELTGKQWSAIVKRITVGAADKSGGRPVLESVNFRVRDNVLYASAADGYVLATGRFEVQAADQEFNLYAKVLKDITVDEDEAVVISHSTGTTVQIHTSNRDVFMTVDKMTYPDVGAITAGHEKIDNIMKMDGKRMKKMAETAGVFARDNADSVQIKIDPFMQEITLMGKSAERGTTEGVIPATMAQGMKPMAVFLNFRYVRRFLGVIADELVVMKMAGEKSPVFLQPENDDSFLYVIMPMGK